MATETAPCPRLLDQVLDRRRVKQFCLRAKQTCVHWIRRFIVFHETRHVLGLVSRE